MKRFFLIVLFVPVFASAFSNLQEQVQYYQELYSHPATTTAISQSRMNSGETRPKAVLKGVYYFGGTNTSRQALSSNYKNLLCENGFSRAYSVYTNVNANVSCGENSLKYSHIGQAKHASDGGPKVAALMEEIYKVIKGNGSVGPIYLHCFYGVHASNTISQMVLKQFCGISDKEGIDNWDDINIYNSLPEPGPSKEKAKIAAFEPNPELKITKEERDLICY